MHRGFIKIYRCLEDNPLWNIKPFSKGQAWVDLLILANHKPSSFEKRGQIVKVGRGQVAHSEKALADRWGWSRKKVDNFLCHLSKESQIEHQKNNVTTLITIKNYNDYNGEEPQKHTRSTPKEPQKHTYKNEENDKNEEKQSLSDVENPLREKVITLYGKTFAKMVSPSDFPKINHIAKNYSVFEITSAFSKAKDNGAKSLQYVLAILESGDSSKSSEPDVLEEFLAKGKE